MLPQFWRQGRNNEIKIKLLKGKSVLVTASSSFGPFLTSSWIFKPSHWAKVSSALKEQRMGPNLPKLLCVTHLPRPSWLVEKCHMIKMKPFSVHRQRSFSFSQIWMNKLARKVLTVIFSRKREVCWWDQSQEMRASKWKGKPGSDHCVWCLSKTLSKSLSSLKQIDSFSSSQFELKFLLFTLHLCT